MSEARIATCDHCHRVEPIDFPDSHPRGWVLIFGPSPFGRMDFCCWGCLFSWVPATRAKLLDVDATSA